MKRILLVDADSANEFPNLALMKLSAWMKELDYEVDLIRGIPEAPPLEEYDEYYISCVFSQNRNRVLQYARMLPIEPKLGGSGISTDKLPDAIEHLMPDYSLYNVKFSMGFTSRGCIRNCPWCIVPEKEGKIRDHAPITEFLEHDKLVLLDNNFQASPKWKENLEFIIENDLSVNFNQGLDFRLLTPEFAELLGKTKFRTWRFNTRRVSFAFDTASLDMELKVRQGIELLANNGVAASAVMVYILVGFNTTINEDLERVKLVEELGASPYIMRFNQTKGPHDILMHLSRFVNWRVNRTKGVEAFHDYDYAGSQAAIKAVFGDSPSPDWDGYYCSQGAYAWDNRKKERG